MIHFIHHGQSIESKWGEFSPRDAELTSHGKVQGRDTAKELLKRGIQPGLIVSSSLKRAVSFSNAMAQSLGYNPNGIQEDKRFDDYGIGSLAGQKQDITPRKFEQATGREDPTAFYERIREGWNAYCQIDNRTEGDTLIVSHQLAHLMLDRVIDGGDIEHFYDSGQFADYVPMGQLPPIATYEPRMI